MLLCALNSYCSLAVCINIAASLRTRVMLWGHHFLFSSLYFTNMFLWSYCIVFSIFKIKYFIFSFWNILLEIERSAWSFEAKTSNLKSGNNYLNSGFWYSTKVCHICYSRNRRETETIETTAMTVQIETRAQNHIVWIERFFFLEF